MVMVMTIDRCLCASTKLMGNYMLVRQGALIRLGHSGRWAGPAVLLGSVQLCWILFRLYVAVCNWMHKF